MQSDSRVLLVEDMPSIHDDFRRILVPDRGSRSLAEAEGALFGTSTEPPMAYQLDCASSGEEGLNLLRAAMLEGKPYALAFVDMRMPAGWDGVRTIEELWREDDQLQVVICTAYSDQPLEQALSRLGSPDRLLVLKKPFDPIEVSQLARALTAKRRLALQSAAHLAKLEQVLREVQEAAQELRRRNGELEMLANTVSHDLRSPMMAISLFSALLSQELRTHRSDKVAGYLDRLRVGAKYGEQLVDGVLSLTEITCSEMAAEPLDLSQIARDVVAQLRQSHPDRQVSTSVQDGLRAWGDGRLVRSAVQHLMENAWKFTARQEMAAITFGADIDADGESVFFVRDSGCGFDAARAGNLFRKFQRLHPPGEFEGGGVGLVAVGRIVDRHGGRVWADSRPGQGTTVFFTLPNPTPAIPRRAA
jgi:two-component system NtrC family sensor kinase